MLLPEHRMTRRDPHGKRKRLFPVGENAASSTEEEEDVEANPAAGDTNRGYTDDIFVRSDCCRIATLSTHNNSDE